MVEVNYALLKDENGSEGIVPFSGTARSVGYDLALPYSIRIRPHSIRTIPLLVAFDIPNGYYIELFPRSSLQTKKGVISSTSIIDSDYKKGIHAILYNSTDEDVDLHEGERVLQFIVKRQEPLVINQVDNIVDDTGRGGLGSTGL